VFIRGEVVSGVSYRCGPPAGANVVPTKKQLAEAAKAAEKVDWAKLDAMTDEEIEAAARSDPDNPPLTGEQLARMRVMRRDRAKKPSAAE